MVDEKILKSVSDTLKILESLRSRNTSELKEQLKDNDLYEEGLSDEEMIDRLLHFFVSEEEMSYYEKYLEYKRVKNANVIAESLDSLLAITEQIDGIYTDRKEYRVNRGKTLENINQLKGALRVLPIIRVSIEHSHVESLKDYYIHARTRDGMQRAKITEAIEDIGRRGIIVRTLKTRQVAKLSEKLKEHDSSGLPLLHKAYDDFTAQIKKYCDLLNNFFNKMLDNDKLCAAAIMSAKLINGDGVDYTKEDLGISKPSKEEIKEVDRESLYTTFVNFSNFPSAEDVTSEMYFKALEEFVLYYESVVYKRSEVGINMANNEVAKLFKKQQEVILGLASKRGEFIIDSSFSEDEDDTFTLIYAKNHGSGKQEKNV